MEVVAQSWWGAQVIQCTISVSKSGLVEKYYRQTFCKRPLEISSLIHRHLLSVPNPGTASSPSNYDTSECVSPVR